MFPIGAFVAMSVANNRNQKEKRDLELKNNVEKFLGKKVFFLDEDIELYGKVIKVLPDDILKILKSNLDGSYTTYKRPTHAVDLYPSICRRMANSALTYFRSNEELIKFYEQGEILTDSQKEFYESLKCANIAFKKFYELEEGKK